MREDSEIAKLCKIYREMDAEGQEVMVAAAVKLFSVQKTSEPQQVSPKLTLPRMSGSFAQSLRFAGIPGYLITAFLLLLAAVVFWVTLINPALHLAGITPLLMARIVITAFCGMVIIGAGLVRFIWRKFTIPWMLLAIGAGILCVEPGALTDLFGIAIFVLIIAIQILGIRREKTVVIR